MNKSRQSGFTLVELLVVIGVIGILAATLLNFLPGAVASGRALKCKANLKTLGQGFSGYAIAHAGNDDDDDAHLPTAGSFEWRTIGFEGNDVANMTRVLWYHSSAAWVSWTPNGAWPYSSKDVSMRDSMEKSIFFDKNPKNSNSKAFFSLTNGVLWGLVGKDAAIYVCEEHKRVAERQTGGRVHRSYVMNRYFGFDDQDNSAPNYTRWLHMDDLTSSGTASIRLLFSELPGRVGTKVDTSMDFADSVLDPDRGEMPGFNHKVGTKWVAHVAFADGHVEGLVMPVLASETELKDLTKQLCNATEIDSKIRAKMQ